MNEREKLKEKKRIVIKIGSSSLTHRETGGVNLSKMEQLVRVLANLRNMGKDVVLVSSGAVSIGRNGMGLPAGKLTLPQKQACASIGQARLMMIYQKLFSEYNQNVSQILMTKFTMTDELSRPNAVNTFEELFHLGVIPIVNENDTIATYEIEFGDNDTLSAIVASLVHADILILLSDIDGLYTDDPNINPNAKFISVVNNIDDKLMLMGKKSTSTDVGTGGMATKLTAARIATFSGADMVIANSDHVSVIEEILNGEEKGTLFPANRKKDFQIMDFI
ncbi:MAG: glutamate 5-kinase [Lachnospiraceae bacterium]|jgi:glutamate 5-kinase|nr:glutamate 5-kinase [Lachnospiraceae bacterium]MCI9371452.1 glutamate 5-kinase [Lachnospiraceae bacterium]